VLRVAEEASSPCGATRDRQRSSCPNQASRGFICQVSDTEVRSNTPGGCQWSKQAPARLRDYSSCQAHRMPRDRQSRIIRSGPGHPRIGARTPAHACRSGRDGILVMLTSTRRRQAQGGARTPGGRCETRAQQRSRPSAFPVAASSVHRPSGPDTLIESVGDWPPAAAGTGASTGRLMPRTSGSPTPSAPKTPGLCLYPLTTETTTAVVHDTRSWTKAR
jgi:hypothetical protein